MRAITDNSWDNRNGPGGAGNTTRTLTHRLVLAERGLAMNATPNESWKPVVGFEGRYQVSDQGRIQGPSGRVLQALSNGSYGYLGVSLGARNRQYVHRIVAEAFIGPGEGFDVDHRDGDTSNNTLSNLRYLTHAENMAAQRERKPNCAKGHSFSDAYWGPDGRRQCRTCRKLADKRRRPKKGGHIGG